MKQVALLNLKNSHRLTRNVYVVKDVENVRKIVRNAPLDPVTQYQVCRHVKKKHVMMSRVRDYICVLCLNSYVALAARVAISLFTQGINHYKKHLDFRIVGTAS